MPNSIKTTYDARANAGYIYLAKEIRPGGAVNQRVVGKSLSEMIILDFDAAGHLIGIELLNARKQLHPDLMPQDWFPWPSTNPDDYPDETPVT